MDQTFAKLNNSFGRKHLSQLEIGKLYKANNFQYLKLIIDMQYKKNVTLDNEFNIFLPDRYVKII